MLRREVEISNPSGLHLRPAGVFCKEAMKFHSAVSIISKGTTANAKSVLSVLAACVKSGDMIELVCDGEDEEDAMDTLLGVIKTGLE